MLPWFFKIPIRIYLFILDIFTIILFRKKFIDLPLYKKEIVITKISNIFPIFQGIEKLFKTLGMTKIIFKNI